MSVSKYVCVCVCVCVSIHLSLCIFEMGCLRHGDEIDVQYPFFCQVVPLIKGCIQKRT